MHHPGDGLTPIGERRRSRRSLVIALVVCAIVVIGLLPSPFIVEKPGPTVDVLGETIVDGESEPVLSVSGVPAYAGDGSLRLTTVSVVGSPDRPRNWWAIARAVVDPSQSIAPLEQYFPGETTADDRAEWNSALMVDSQTQAAAAAFREIGEDVSITLRVASVVESGPADGILQSGDVIVAAAGHPVSDFTDLRERIGATEAGRGLTVQVERDNQAVEVLLDPQIPEGGISPMIGATIAVDYELPAEIEVALDDIGGPSAGLIFALGIVELLSPDTRLGDTSVFGTGTIDDRGAVGAIGGLEQKMWAASRAGGGAFLMPLDNCVDVPSTIPPGLDVFPVATLGEALESIDAAAEENAPGGLERCAVSSAR
ncbi:MAG: PDZ domain-containing protein [Leucobacter sp.]